MEKNSFRKYLLVNSMVGLGAANGILTVLVFWLKAKRGGVTEFYAIELQNELMMTSIVIGLTVTIISNLFTRRDIKKQKIAKQSQKHIIQQLIPATKPYRAIYSIAYSVLGTYAITKIILILDSGNYWNVVQSLILIFCVSTFASAITAYFNIIKTAYEYEE